jgi:hypothetical protein
VVVLSPLVVAATAAFDPMQTFDVGPEQDCVS